MDAVCMYVNINLEKFGPIWGLDHVLDTKVFVQSFLVCRPDDRFLGVASSSSTVHIFNLERCCHSGIAIIYVA